MNLFVNREDELGALQSLYDQPGSRLMVLYGRRRLGKTRLLRQFSGDKPSVYFMADQAGEVSQRNNMARTMAYALDEPVLAQAEYADWYDLFAAFDRLRPKDRKIVLMLDEYQYLCSVQPAFSSFIQKWWDEKWRSGNVLLILCGSLTSMMYRETLAQSSPLYGRADGQILLRPLSYRHVGEFVANPDEATCVERYALCGGVPRYLELLSGFDGFESALIEGVLEPFAPLHNEARILLQTEIDVPNTCWSLLEAMASGASRISEMASRLGQPANALTRYIALLRDLFIVQRTVPVAEENPAKSKKGLYTVADSFLGLWFGCVYPYESLLEIGDIKPAVKKLRPLLNRHVQRTYEELCREYARRHLVDGTKVIRMGRQWGAHYEIDVAGVDAAGRFTVLGECKWSGRRVGLSVLRELRKTAKKQELPVAADAQWLLFGKSGFTTDLEAYAARDKSVRLIQSLFR